MRQVETLFDLYRIRDHNVRVGHLFDDVSAGTFALCMLLFDDWGPLCDVTGIAGGGERWAAGYTVEWALYSRHGRFGISRGKWLAPQGGLPSGSASVRVPRGAALVTHTHPLNTATMDRYRYVMPGDAMPRSIGREVHYGAYEAFPSWADMALTPERTSQHLFAPYVYAPGNVIKPVIDSLCLHNESYRRHRLALLKQEFLRGDLLLCGSVWEGHQEVTKDTYSTSVALWGMKCQGGGRVVPHRNEVGGAYTATIDRERNGQTVVSIVEKDDDFFEDEGERGNEGRTALTVEEKEDSFDD